MNPREGIERAHLDTDPAIHAETEIDAEFVQDFDRPTARAGRESLRVGG